MENPITKGLIIANIIVFLLVFSMPEKLMENVFNAFAFSSGTAIEPWRWVTSLFLHVSASHLFFNMLGLFFFGRILEEEVPKGWFLAIYFVAGLLGNFVFMFTSASPVVGASGAMFGIMGAAMLLNPIKRVHLYVFPLPLGIVAVTFIVFETLATYYKPAEIAVDNVAHISHVAGILTGAIFAFFNSPKRSMKGILVLVLSLLLLVLLSPVFALISGIGGLILEVIDFVVGIVLYNLASLLAFLWA
ncbi:MAG: rhomboid family intramembrane serine protease [Candidatus Aenigmarchaeota archaeon]|nr:rhomboid family intramembrane serine protease [Candidatus Aenigmarchaeota archaeon]